MVDRIHLINFFENKTKISLFLKNGRYFSGFIISMGETSFMFKDKLDNELPFNYDSIDYIDVFKEPKWVRE